MRRTFTSILALSLSLLPFVTRAQSTGALQQGVRVRVVPKHGEEKVGRVVGMTPDSIQIASEGSPRFVSSFATTDIGRLDKSEGISAGNGAARGGFIGFLVGGAGGFAAAFVSNKKELGLAGPVGFLLGGLGGAAVGASIGASRGTETWVTLGRPYVGSANDTKQKNGRPDL